MVKLWELSTSRCLISYTGAGTLGLHTHRSNAVFNHTEDYGESDRPSPSLFFFALSLCSFPVFVDKAAQFLHRHFFRLNEEDELSI